MATTHREPRVPFSKALAIAKWPANWDRAAVIALIYDDARQLRRDYERTSVWRHIDGVSAFVHSAYLEKEPGGAGRSYFDFGWRRYRTRHNGQPYAEQADERIAVKMAGGSNRPAVLGMLERADEMAVLFSLVASFEDISSLQGLVGRLCRGQFPTADGTVLIPIKGLTVFGRFHPVSRSRKSTLRA